MTQNSLIVEHLIKFGSITTNEAFAMYQIKRLAARMLELQKEGFTFVREFIGRDRADYRYSLTEDMLEQLRKTREARETCAKYGYRISLGTA